MVRSIFTLASVLPLFLAVNGAVVQRDGNFARTTVNCNGVQPWQAALAYVAGNQVIFSNQLYDALQWTYNNTPIAHPDQWALEGTCTQPISNQANCNGIAAWQKNTAYTTGQEVTFNNNLWSAVQWTESNVPGDNSGLWKDLGVCS